MATDPALRQGPDSTDLVLRAGPTGPVWTTLTSAGPALAIPLVLGAPTLVVAVWMALAGAQASTVFAVVGVIVGLEYLIGWPALALSRARDILRVEFTPAAGVPTSLRLVRAARPDAWLPVEALRQVLLTHKVVEPYQGDDKPAVSTLTLEITLQGTPERLTLPFGGDPQRLATALKDLLGPAGVMVALRTERSTRDRPQPNSRWTSGGSASAGSGGG
ncbi:hypothetical protein [Streptomyces sp. NPDC056144]|uniref:hypothetical protein n=1 Tax=unclassified Streptomyces TaxID=2593676 RepID=UPI0035E0EA8F